MLSTLFCGNEHHNLIMICVKKYFLLFTMSLLPGNFTQCSLAFVCDKEHIHIEVPGASSQTRAGTALACQVLLFSLSPEACLGVWSCTQPLVFILKSTYKNSCSSPCYATWTHMHKELPWTSFQKATENLSVEKYSLHYWFELESDWQLGEKFPTPMQFSTCPEKKMKYCILSYYIKYKMQAVCQGIYIQIYIYIYIWTPYIWSSIIF